MALRTNILFQKLFYPLHTLFILDLGKCVFHGVNGIVVGEIKFSRLIGVLCFVKNMLLHSRPVIDDLFFFCGQITERHIGTHTHFTAHIGHQRPHQSIPRSDCALVNAKCVIRHKTCHIYGSDAACATTGLTGALRIER